MGRLNDSTGLFPLYPGAEVEITHPRSAYVGEKGRVTEVAGHKVKVALDSGFTTKIGHRSVTVIPEKRRPRR